MSLYAPCSDGKCCRVGCSTCRRRREEKGARKWDRPKEDKEAAAGALLVLGGMLYEWGLPLDRAIEGLKRAYQMEAAKQVHACTCHNERDRELCGYAERCAEVRAFGANVGGSTNG